MKISETKVFKDVWDSYIKSLYLFFHFFLLFLLIMCQGNRCIHQHLTFSKQNKELKKKKKTFEVVLVHGIQSAAHILVL